MNEISDKKDHFRQQIRRKQLQASLRVMRHDITEKINLVHAEKIVTDNFREIDRIIDGKQPQEWLPNERLSLLLKELRDINCIQIAPALFAHSAHLTLLLKLQNEPQLDQISQRCLHEILLNVSANEEASLFKFTVLHLSVSPYLLQNKPMIIRLVLEICGNLLLRDQTSASFFSLANKVLIFRRLIEFLINKPQVYKLIRPSFLWLANKLITEAKQWNYSSMNDHHFGSFVKMLSDEILTLFRHPDDRDEITWKELLQYLRTLWKTEEQIEINEDFIDFLVSEQNFDVKDQFYLQTMCTLTYRTCFCFPKQQLKQLLMQALQYPNGESTPTIIRLLTNCLSNDGSHWKLFMNTFIKMGSELASSHQTCALSHLLLSSQLSMTTCLFIYFLREQKTRKEICEIMHYIISGQGGLGVLEECVEVIYDYKEGYEMMTMLGFETQ